MRQVFFLLVCGLCLAFIIECCQGRTLSSLTNEIQADEKEPSDGKDSTNVAGMENGSKDGEDEADLTTPKNPTLIIPRISNDVEESQDDEPKTKKRPVLNKKSFGYRHAQHLNPAHSRHREQLSSLFGRQKQTFQTRPESNIAHCSVADFRCELHQKYRKSDGSCNNLRRPVWGQSGTPYRRLLARKHSLVDCGNAALSRLPNARLASRLLAKRSEADVSKSLSIYVMVWGQLIDHDMMMTPVRQTEEEEFLDCCDPANHDAEDCCPIRIPRGDFFYGQVERPDCIPFLRSKLTQFPGNCRHRFLPDVENMNTAWLDMSYLYGSTDERAEFLKAEEGGKLMASEDRSNRVFPHISAENGFRMEFGDSRGDVHPAFTLLNTAFLRLHNILADKLAELHPGWSKDKLYLEARKINAAIAQHITYTQFMDAILGTPNAVRTDDRVLHKDYYRPSVDPRISMIFSTAAFRLHTYVSGRFELRDHRYRPTRSLKLRDIFHDPLQLLANNTYDELTRGLAAQSVHDFNNVYTSEMTEWLFAEKDKDFGFDIVSLNVQRGRDHQIQGYTNYKEFCGLGSANSWNDLEDFMPHEDVHRLVHTYRKPEDVDMYIGANMEVPVKGSMVGPTMHCFIREQFEALRDGDRFFYTRPTEFTARQLAAIKKVSLSSVLCQTADNPSIMRLPRNAFKKINQRNNPIFPCTDLPSLDFSAWA